MLTDCLEGTNFHQYRILMQHTECYLPHVLCFHYICCARTILGIYLWWDPYERIPLMRSGITWTHDMGDHPILLWGWPSWHCMMRPQHQPLYFALLLHREACSQILLVSSSWILMHPLWALSIWSIHCLLNSVLSLHNHCRWCGKGFLVFLFLLFGFDFIIPNFPTLGEH